MQVAYITKRLILLGAFIPCVFCAVNLLTGMHIFGRFDTKILVGSFVVLFLVARYFAPTIDEVQAARDANRAAKRQ